MTVIEFRSHGRRRVGRQGQNAAVQRSPGAPNPLFWPTDDVSPPMAEPLEGIPPVGEVLEEIASLLAGFLAIVVACNLLAIALGS